MDIFDYKYYLCVLKREFSFLDVNVLFDSIGYAILCYLENCKDTGKNKIKEPRKWILRTARNFNYRYIKEHNNFTAYDDQTSYDRLGFPKMSDETEEEKAEYYDKLFNIIFNNLTKRDIEIIILHYFDALKFKDIAKKLKISEYAVYKRHSRVLKKLREILPYPPPLE